MAVPMNIDDRSGGAMRSNAFLWALFGLLMALGGAAVAALMSWAYIDYRPARDDAEAWVFITIPAGWLTGALIAAIAGSMADRRQARPGRSRRFFALIGPLMLLLTFITWFVYLNATVH